MSAKKRSLDVGCEVGCTSRKLVSRQHWYYLPVRAANFTTLVTYSRMLMYSFIRNYFNY